MNLADTIRQAVALADSTTATLQVNVAHYPWIGSNNEGGPLYGAPIIRKAIVEERDRTRRLINGQEITEKAKITIPRSIAANGATGRSEPIDPRDKFVLPNGATGPVVDVMGIADPSTNYPYMYEVILGWSLV